MLKPSDIATIPAPDTHAAQRAQIEKHFDEALVNAARTGRWPARINETRSGWSRELVSEVIEYYRIAGWLVNDGGNGVIATISRPDTDTAK